MRPCRQTGACFSTRRCACIRMFAPSHPSCSMMAGSGRFPISTVRCWTARRRFAGAGLWFVPVDHDGNQSSSPGGGRARRSAGRRAPRGWRALDRTNERAAPFAARRHPDHRAVQRSGRRARRRACRRAPASAPSTSSRAKRRPWSSARWPHRRPKMPRAGWSSSTASTASTSPSRARRCACILVGNPRLFEPECRTPAQMRLANAFCRYLEMAQTVALEAGA